MKHLYKEPEETKLDPTCLQPRNPQCGSEDRGSALLTSSSVTVLSDSVPRQFHMAPVSNQSSQDKREQAIKLKPAGKGS